MTPGQQSKAGTIFEMVDEYGVHRLLDYVFDRTDGPGVVYVLSGWWDPYGGRGCASGTIEGKPEPLSSGGWRIGNRRLEPHASPGYEPALTRDEGRRYARADSLSAAGE